MEKTGKTIVVERGVLTLGSHTTDADGNIISRTPQRWDARDDGQCLIVCPVDTETYEPLCDASICHIRDTEALLTLLLDALGLSFRNTPDLAAIWRAAAEDGVDLCHYCQETIDKCGECILRE